MKRISRTLFASVVWLGTALAAPTEASTESELNALWRGAWTVVEVETYSDCQGNYTNNEVRQKRVRAKAEHRFSRGELATVHKINLKRKRVDVLVNLIEPILAARREGPFTLYDSLQCKVELQIQFPPGVSSNKSREVDGLIASILERHDSADLAEGSATWNRRLREPLPEDYDETLLQYEHWRVEQLNARVAARIEDSVEDAARLVDRLGDDPDYLDGFAQGVDRGREVYRGDDCDRLLSMSRSSFVKNAPGDHGRAFREGYREGQELVFFLESARRLPRCFVPPPR